MSIRNKKSGIWFLPHIVVHERSQSMYIAFIVLEKKHSIWLDSRRNRTIRRLSIPLYKLCIRIFMSWFSGDPLDFLPGFCSFLLNGYWYFTMLRVVKIRCTSTFECLYTSKRGRNPTAYIGPFVLRENQALVHRSGCISMCCIINVNEMKMKKIWFFQSEIRCQKNSWSEKCWTWYSWLPSRKGI